MPVLVDAYNVLHVTGVLPPDLAGPDLDDLAELVHRSRYSHARTTLVCDGTPRPGRPGLHAGGVRIIFSGPARSADDVIVQAIRKSSDPRRLTVVTSDRQILREARKRRCETLSSEGFLGQIARDHERRRPGKAAGADDADPDLLSPGQVMKWIATFAVTEADLRIDDQPARGAPDDDATADAASAAVSGAAPDADPEAAPPRPATPSRRSVLPAALLAEAEALVRAEPPPPVAPPAPEVIPEGTPGTTSRPTAGPTSGRQSGSAPDAAGTVLPATGPPPARRGDPLLPMDVLREAAALAGERAADPGATDEPPSAPPRRHHRAPVPRPTRDHPVTDRVPEEAPRPAPLPADIIAEAEALLRGEAPPPSPDTDAAAGDR